MDNTKKIIGYIGDINTIPAHVLEKAKSQGYEIVSASDIDSLKEEDIKLLVPHGYTSYSEKALEQINKNYNNHSRKSDIKRCNKGIHCRIGGICIHCGLRIL